MSKHYGRLSDVAERAQIRKRRTALGISGIDLDRETNSTKGETLHFEAKNRPLNDREKVVYGRMMDALDRFERELPDYGAMIGEWLDDTGLLVEDLARYSSIHRRTLSALLDGECRTQPRPATREELDRFFTNWHRPKPMTPEQRGLLVQAEERWKMIEADASARVLIDFYDPTDDELAA